MWVHPQIPPLMIWGAVACYCGVRRLWCCSGFFAAPAISWGGCSSSSPMFWLLTLELRRWEQAAGFWEECCTGTSSSSSSSFDWCRDLRCHGFPPGPVWALERWTGGDGDSCVTHYTCMWVISCIILSCSYRHLSAVLVPPWFIS